MNGHKFNFLNGPNLGVPGFGDKIKFLNDMKEVDRAKFIALVRANLGVPAFGDSCGFHKIAKSHGGKSDGLACVECDNFKVNLQKGKAGYWQITGNSVLEHGRYDTAGNWMECSIGKGHTYDHNLNMCIIHVVSYICNIYVIMLQMY